MLPVKEEEWSKPCVPSLDVCWHVCYVNDGEIK